MRYLIGLAARTFDPEGAMLVPWQDGTESESIARRVNRVRTLDGGVSVSDRGHAPGDRTLTLSLAGLPLATVERARRLLRLHGQLTVSLRDGCYTGTPREYNERQKTLTVLISGAA